MRGQRQFGGMVLCVAVLAVFLGGATPGWANVMTYTSSSAFNAAISGDKTSVENYGSFTAATQINAGQTFDGITYTAFTPGPLADLLGGIITNQFNSFTGLSLGGRQSTGAQFFFGGDSVTVTFSQPVNALGVFFNVNPSSGNYGFTTAPGAASTGSASYDTSTFVFAGLVSSTPFTSATIFSTDSALGSYNLPEIITATSPPPISTPEPSSLALLGVGGVALAGWRRWKKRQVTA